MSSSTPSTDLAVGECIVHIEHGIGVYKGIKKLSLEGSEKTFSSSSTRMRTGFTYLSIHWSWSRNTWAARRLSRR